MKHKVARLMWLTVYSVKALKETQIIDSILTRSPSEPHLNPTTHSHPVSVLHRYAVNERRHMNY